jgi:HEPN domain-containing protein
MRPETKEWLAKAEGDFACALREWRARTHPNYDDLCFHSQQCIEKYLKARLTEADQSFSKTHDLTMLLDLALPHEPLWETLRPELTLLSGYAVMFRYPGESATREQARVSLQHLKALRKLMRQSLGLPLK